MTLERSTRYRKQDRNSNKVYYIRKNTTFGRKNSDTSKILGIKQGISTNIEANPTWLPENIKV